MKYANQYFNSRPDIRCPLTGRNLIYRKPLEETSGTVAILAVPMRLLAPRMDWIRCLVLFEYISQTNAILFQSSFIATTQ